MRLLPLLLRLLPRRRRQRPVYARAHLLRDAAHAFKVVWRRHREACLYHVHAWQGWDRGGGRGVRQTLASLLPTPRLVPPPHAHTHTHTHTTTTHHPSRVQVLLRTSTRTPPVCTQPLTQLVQLARYRHLLFAGQVAPRRLLAVSQRRVDDAHLHHRPEGMLVGSLLAQLPFKLLIERYRERKYMPHQSSLHLRAAAGRCHAAASLPAHVLNPWPRANGRRRPREP